ncbi:hypothetical protein [Meiothermus cerbereus]|uniref:hypothetical protein n=1 Tax=Meiothermus cerbereus TaxID=65552 RepID=UPI00047F395D|nr:hypothetical protein [Meiothermus cerbereus]
MKRKRLAELVKEETEALREASPAGEGPEEAPTREAPSEERPLPPYLTYVRKECRLRPDQLDALTALARRLNRERRGNGERITENTLIRWAVDLLLERFESKNLERPEP